MDRADLRRRISDLRRAIEERRLGLVLGPSLPFERPLPSAADFLVDLHLGLAEGPHLVPSPSWVEALGLPLDVDEPLMLLAELFARLRGHAALRERWVAALAAVDPTPTTVHHLAGRLARLGCAKVVTAGWDGTLALATAVEDEQLLQGSFRRPETLVLTASEHREAFGAGGSRSRRIAELFASTHVLLLGLGPEHTVLRGVRPGPHGATYVRLGPSQRVDEIWAAMGWSIVAPATDTPQGAAFLPWLLEQGYGHVIPDQAIEAPRRGAAAKPPPPTAPAQPPLGSQELARLGATLEALAPRLLVEVDHVAGHLGLGPERRRCSWPALVELVAAGGTLRGEGRTAVIALLREIKERYGQSNTELPRIIAALERGEPLPS